MNRRFERFRVQEVLDMWDAIEVDSGEESEKPTDDSDPDTDTTESSSEDEGRENIPPAASGET